MLEATSENGYENDIFAAKIGSGFSWTGGTPHQKLPGVTPSATLYV